MAVAPIEAGGLGSVPNILQKTKKQNKKQLQIWF